MKMRHEMMAETHQCPPRAEARQSRSSRARLAQRVIGAIYLALALGAVLFALVTWWVGRLNPINALIFALTAAGTGPIGLLALGDDYPASRRMDEGQREMDRAAKSNAFHVAYFGLYALFFGALFFPTARDALPVAIGVLLLLVSLTWAGSYMWGRWRP
jgi:hypothetical protein